MFSQYIYGFMNNGVECSVLKNFTYLPCCFLDLDYLYASRFEYCLNLHISFDLLFTQILVIFPDQSV